MIKLRTLLLQSRWFYLLFVLSLIISFYKINFIKYESVYNINESNFKFIITKYKIDGDKLTLELLGKEKIIGNYYFEKEEEIKEFKKKYDIGDKILLKGTLSIPKNNTMPNTFNYKKYLYNKKIFYTLKIEEFSLIKKDSNIFYKIKNHFYKRIENIKDNEYLYAFILGEKSYIDSSIYKSYSDNGVTHLFALSGLHVSTLSAIILFLLNKLKISEINKYIISFILLVLISFITGFSPSILRASLLFFLIGINKTYYFYIKIENLLLCVGSILIFINPFIIYELSFLLSFVITYFILLNIKWYSKNYIISLLKVSFISFLASLPIIINNFYQINILSIINNMFFVPFVTFIVYPLSLIVYIFPCLIKIFNFFVVFMEKISIILNNIDIFTIYIPKISFVYILIYYIFLIIYSYLKRTIFIVIILLIIFSNYLYPKYDKNNYVYFLDVDQGDSSLIITKNNKTILIDTGGILKYENRKKRNNEFNLMISSMLPFFKSIGVSKIDYLILTHGDDDHMGYSKDLVKNFKVENVIFNTGEFNKLELELIKLLIQKKIKYFQNSEVLNIDKINFYFLNTKKYNDENNNSNVLFTEINGVKLIFTGDASMKREKDILTKYDLNNIDIIKIGHHGSNTSSSREFIDSINPKTCLISVGENNKYGHPKEAVLNLLADYCSIYRTDLNGSIEIRLNKNSYNIKTYNP